MVLSIYVPIFSEDYVRLRDDMFVLLLVYVYLKTTSLQLQPDCAVVLSTIGYKARKPEICLVEFSNSAA